jgi:hypothetical protein
MSIFIVDLRVEPAIADAPRVPVFGARDSLVLLEVEGRRACNV